MIDYEEWKRKCLAIDEVIIDISNDTGEWLYIIPDPNEPEYWLNGFVTLREALYWCCKMNYTIVDSDVS